MADVNVLITGGAGFIGRALVDRCLRAGHAVTVIDNLCAGRLSNLEPFLDGITFVEADILDAGRVDEVMAQARPALVFHLAAHHFIPFCNEHPQETLRVNVEGTHVVLSAAAAHGADVAVVASSGAFYPSRDDLLREDLGARPVDVYGLSKQMTEHTAEFIANTTGMTCVAARLFNTYGPYETNPHIVPHIVECLRRGPLVELGNIHTRRDYIYVEDVADLLLRCARGVDGGYTTVNVGTGVEYSAEQIVRLIEQALGTPVEIRVDDTRVRAVDKLHQRADIARLEALTGTRPAHSLMEGLERLLHHEQLLTPHAYA
jgi:UDP-glucose 4-epimerase